MFVEPGDPVYPSECDISASDEHVYDYISTNVNGQYWWGNGDDRWCKKVGGFQWAEHTPWNCLADYMGASMYFFRQKGEGSSWTVWQDNFDSTAILKWRPPTYPYPNISGNTKLDLTYGLAQYIADYAGYYCQESTATNDMDTYNDVYNYYTRVIRGYNSNDPTNGVWPHDIINEIDAGRPVMAVLVNLSSIYKYEIRTTQHAFPVFGYKEEDGQPLKLLVYDTWYEDYDPNLLSTYRIIKFPTTEEVQYMGVRGATTETLRRASNGEYWKLVAFSFLQINNNPRCPLPLGTNDYTSGTYQDEFDIDFDLPAGNSRVHYDGRMPTPASPAVTLDANGDGTLHVDQDCVLNFRTYRDATPPDGYLASDVVRRVYSVFSANKNIKKFADGTAVTMVNGIVTHVIDSNSFYFEERDKRLFGIRVCRANHGLSADDEVEVVVGSIETDASNEERYIEATSVTETNPPSKVISPYCMTNICLGGKDYLPSGGSETGYGQKGVANSININNVGLLVRTAGEVTYIDTNSDCFTISDGSGAIDSGSHDGVKVLASGFIPQGLAVGDIVTATGICSLEKVSSVLYPIIAARDSSDLVVIP